MLSSHVRQDLRYAMRKLPYQTGILGRGLRKRGGEVIGAHFNYQQSSADWTNRNLCLVDQ